MSFKITPLANPILGPVAVFGIIWGIASMIGLPLSQVFVPFSGSTRRIVLLAAVFVAAVAGSVYSFVFARRGRATLSWVDRGFYYFFWPLVFFSIFVFGVYLSRE